MAKLHNPGFLPCRSAAEAEAKRRAIRKDAATHRAARVIQTLSHRDIIIAYTDGSSKFDEHKGHIGGYGIYIANELELSQYAPPTPTLSARQIRGQNCSE